MSTDNKRFEASFDHGDDVFIFLYDFSDDSLLLVDENEDLIARFPSSGPAFNKENKEIGRLKLIDDYWYFEQTDGNLIMGAPRRNVEGTIETEIIAAKEMIRKGELTRM